MNDCTQAQNELLASSGQLLELSQSIRVHVEACEDCRSFAVKQRRLRRLAKSTQEIVRKDLDLPPSAWVRIRQSVEDEAKPDSMFVGFLRWFPVAALPVLIIALGWTLLNQPAQVGDQKQVGSAPTAQSMEPTRAALSPEAGEFRVLGQTAGSSIEVGGTPSVAALDQGHRLAFLPHSKAKVVELSDKRVALNLESGQVTCEVRKLRSDEAFVVIAKDLRVSVVGTRFTVMIDADGIPSVSVTEGRVAVSRVGQEDKMLGAGESLQGKKPDEPGPDVVAKLGDVEAGTDVSGVPIMQKETKVASPKKTRKRTSPAKPKAIKPVDSTKDSTAQADPKKTEKVIDVTVSETMSPRDEDDDTGVRSRLVGVIGMIRSGNCSAAQSALTTINLLDGAPRFRGDITYLSGYCHRKQGNVGRAERLFNLYEKLAGNRRWKIPTSHDEILPIPSPSHLRR